MPRAVLGLGMRQAAGLKLARLLSMREEDFARLVREAEKDPLFERLRRAGALSRTPFPRAYFTARRLAGRELAAPVRGLGDLLDGRSDLVRLMRKAGRERFEECFLQEDGMSDEERGRRCGLSVQEARMLREMIDRITILSGFESAAPAPPKTFSAVAGIGLEKGQPHLRFFHRDVWKGSYRVAQDRLRVETAAMTQAERGRAQRLAALVADRPGLSDEGLRRELAARWQIRLSRRSIAQYRKDLGLPSSRTENPSANAARTR